MRVFLASLALLACDESICPYIASVSPYKPDDEWITRRRVVSLWRCFEERREVGGPDV